MCSLGPADARAEIGTEGHGIMNDNPTQYRRRATDHVPEPVDWSWWRTVGSAVIVAAAFVVAVLYLSALVP
jgi:hypothetical protein